MRCGRCGKSFDEEMYSGICPKCGHFNNRRAEYDVSRYFSAKFDGQEKVSTSAQAAKQHAKLHKMYDQYNMHRQGQQGRAKLSGAGKEKNIVPVICVVIAIAAIIATFIACNIKRMQVAQIYESVDYEQEFAEPGEIFEVNGRLLVVEKAEIVDTSMLEGISKGDSLAAVTVEVLPAEGWSGSRGAERVYLSDGLACRQCLDSYTLGDILVRKENEAGDYYVEEDNVLEQLYALGEFDEEEILTGYNYLDYDSVGGKTGKFYFLMDKDAETIEISFDQEMEKDGIPVLEKRVSIPLAIEERAQ